MPPQQLAQIGTWQELINQTKLEGFYGFRTRKQEEAEIDVEGVGKIKKGNVMHVIAQELKRLDDWQNNPPTKPSSGIDPIWQTVLVAIPGGNGKGQELIVTYGELNTLADYYGNLEVMKTADPKVRWEIVQSVRQETFFRLKNIYGELKDSLTDTEKKQADVQAAGEMMENNQRVNQTFGYKFKDAILQDYISGDYGQINLLTVTGTGAKGTNEYGATLARNACHFVPESWHSWASYHQSAREKAKAAYSKKQEVSVLYYLIEHHPEKTDEYHKQINKLQDESATDANEAILNNGFGDHYLQDSYAAGHMINKTQIMQWFVQWLDTQKWAMDFASDERWSKVQQIAYNQPGLAASEQYNKSQVQGFDQNQTTNRARNPQSVENLEGDWKVRFDALGLQVPVSLRDPNSYERKLTEWLQTIVIKGGENKVSGADLLTGSDGSEAQDLEIFNGVNNLVKDGIFIVKSMSAADRGELMTGKNSSKSSWRTSWGNFNQTEFKLRQAYIPKDIKRFATAQAASKEGDDTQYQRMAAAVTYSDYFEFLNDAYVQKSTNALHNKFCEGGLYVSSGTNESLFKVYGDDSMFKSESAKGVKHSGETANMSRDAILNIINKGDDKGITTQAILERLPAYVKPEGVSSAISIEAWHNPSQEGSLKDYCFNGVFPSMGLKDKFVALKGSMGDGLTSNVSKDKEKVHGGETF